MKQMIRKRLCIVILTAMLISLFVNYFQLIHNAQSGMYRNSQNKFWQIGQILNQPLRTVQSRLRAALKTIKKDLERGGISSYEEI